MMMWFLPGIDGRFSIPALISSFVRSRLYPTAAPASALDTMWIPGSGTTHSKEVPFGMWSVHEVPLSPSGLISVARKSLLSPVPKNTGSTPLIGPDSRKISSSPLKMMVPPFFISWIIWDFSWKIPSLVLKNSKWATPMFVITHTSGLATEESLRISPKWLTPISRIATWFSSFISKIVIGSPHSLLKFPNVL